MSVELLRRDVHPAEVLLPGGRLLRETRAFVTDRRVLAYKRQDGQIQRVLDLELVGEPPTASRASLGGGTLELECEDGVVFVNQGSGCGCGSPLKALAPPVGWTRKDV